MEWHAIFIAPESARRIAVRGMNELKLAEELKKGITLWSDPPRYESENGWWRLTARIKG